MTLESDALLTMRLQQAREAFQKRDFPLALVEAEELLDQHPDDVDALMVVGDASLELGEAMGAAAAFCRILQFQARSPIALAGLAIARFELTDLEEAISNIGLEINPEASTSSRKWRICDIFP